MSSLLQASLIPYFIGVDHITSIGQNYGFLDRRSILNICYQFAHFTQVVHIAPSAISVRVRFRQNCGVSIEIDEEEDEDFDEEAEAAERYPFLYGKDGKEERTMSVKQTKDEGIEMPAEQSVAIPEQKPEINYHYLYELDEETLAKLDFYRFDNFFAARPAHGFFLDNADEKPRAPRLFGDYWLEGEIAILFADTGTGKSILATQIAQSIASGIPIEPFGLDTQAQRVAYFDLELSQEQFDRRYSHDDTSRPAKFPFHRNLIRNPPHPQADRPPNFKDETQFITASMVEFIEFSKARVVIVDNITWLNNSAQIGNSAPRLMKALSRLKQRLGLSILVLAHTPKRRLHSPMTENDIQGSKLIANYPDTIFALGSSRKGNDIRYIKSVKRRNAKAEEQNRTATLRLEKDVCLLGFRFIEHSDERDHIGWMSSAREPERMMLIEKILELDKLGLSQRQIGLELGVSASTVNRCLKDVIE